MEVFLVWHVHHAADHRREPNGEFSWDEREGDDPKLLGVFSSRRLAQERVDRARRQPGFADEPDCFVVDAYRVDQDAWSDGFVTV